MPGIIEALADSGTPLSILTKGTLLRRDLPLLRTAADAVPVDLAMSIAVYDDTLQDSLEPGTPTTAARLATVRAAADLGFPVRVFLMPVLPYLTDSTDQLNDALRRIKDAGADSVVYGALHLRPGAREWFFRWLDEHRPDLRGAYEGMYARSAYAPRAYRRMLSQRIGPLLQRWGLAAQHDDDHGSAPAAASGTRVARGPRVAPGATAASRARAQADQEQPALF
jgi:DNA repair photolyase